MRSSVLIVGVVWSALSACGGDSSVGPSAGAGAAAPGNAGTGAAGGMAGAAGTIAPISFAQSIQPKIDEACNCHQSTPILMAPFSLKVGEAYGNLVGTASQQLPTMQRVKPGSLNESYLWHKINGTQLEVGGSGLIMPSNIPLSEEEIDLFARWIATGAQP